jgi:hypothetical protein
MTQQSPDCQFHFSKPFDRSTVISGGSTAIVERLACGHVRKSPFPDDTVSGRRASLLDIEREHDVYLRIANQPHILEMAELNLGGAWDCLTGHAERYFTGAPGMSRLVGLELTTSDVGLRHLGSSALATYGGRVF